MKFHVTFNVMIENESHVFEVAHSQISGTKRIWVDGVQFLQLKGWKEFFDSGLIYIHPERIGGHEVRVTVTDAKGHPNPMLWRYQVLLDGESVADLDQRR